MAFKRTGRAPRSRRRRVVPKRTQKIRQLAGQRPITAIEHIAGYGRDLGTVARTVAQMAGLINSEVKFIDQTLSSAITNTGSTANELITQIGEGDDINQRNGRFILAKSLQWKMSFAVNPSATGASIIGYALIMDKKPSIALSGTPWTDVFVQADPNSLIAKGTNSDRWVILRRGIIDLSLQNASKHLKGFLSLKGIHIKYNGASSTNLETNAIYLLLISNQATNTPTVTGSIRFEYHDN